MRHELSNQELEAALEALGGLEPAGATSDRPAPALESVLDRAAGRTKSIRRNNMLRNAGSTLLLMLIGAVATALFTLAPRGNGWAVTEGWIVEYEIEVPAYYGFDIIGRGVQGVETPQSRLEQLVRDWSAEHASNAPAEGTELATLNVGQPSPQSGQSGKKQENYFVHRAKVQLTFMSDDAELLDELLALLRAPGGELPPLQGEVKKYSKTWITHEKYPELYEPAKVWINGEVYDFPADFKAQRDIDTLAGLLPRQSLQAHMRPEGRGSSLYYNLFTSETRERTGLELLCRLDYTERGLEISPVDDEGAFDGLELQPAEAMWGVQMGATYDSKGLPMKSTWTLEDYRSSLLSRLKEASALHEDEYVTLETWQLKYLLFPPSRFIPGQPSRAYAVSPTDKQQALTLWAAYKAAFDEWLASHPDYVLRHGSPGHAVWMQAVAGGELLGHFERGTKYLEQPMWCFDATLTGLSQVERVELKDRLDLVDPGATSFVWRLSDQKVPKEDLETVEAPRE